MTDDRDDEKRALLYCLDYQRDSVLSILDGLSEEGWHTAIVPSGWTPAGLLEHLGGAERHWFLGVVDGSNENLPWDVGRPDYDPEAALTCDRTATEIINYYREQCTRSDAVLARTAMSAAPRGRHDGGRDVGPSVPSVRWVVLHMIEETAAHSGHLEIARELLDGATNLGQR